MTTVITTSLFTMLMSQSSDPYIRMREEKDFFESMARALIRNSLDIHVENVFRLGKLFDDNATKPRLMLVWLKTKEHVDVLFKKRL